MSGLFIGIDHEFESLCRPLTADESAGLKTSIIAEGCRDALIVWQETGLLLDGHNRKRICEELGLSYRTLEISLPDRDAALLWIINNQLQRRNLTPQESSYLRGKRYGLEKKAEGFKGNQYTSGGGHFDHHQPKTDERIAAETGVSERTVRRDAQFAAAVDKIAEIAGDEARAKVLAGESSIRKGDAEQILKIAEDAPELIPQIASGAIDIKQAIGQRDGNVYQPVAATMFSHKSLEYYTPVYILDAAREVLGDFDLDPASCEAAQENVRAMQYYTPEQDGLTQVWRGRVWLNPPYSKTDGKSNQELWSQKLLAEYHSGNVTSAILLVKAAFGYKWFEALFDELPVCLARERLPFIREDGNDDGESKQGTALFYLGPDKARFYAVFKHIGRIIPNAIEIRGYIEQHW